MKENAKKIIQKGIDTVIPYENNPRKNDNAVDKVANSIRAFGFRQPIVIDEHNVVICGHTRLKAAKKLGLKQVPCIVAEGLTDAEIKAYRIADNKVAELAEWDDDLLQGELEQLEDFDMTQFGMEELDEQLLDEDKYESKGQTPIYEITSECPKITELFDNTNTERLKKLVEEQSFDEDTKEFLRICCDRFTVFNFAKIAEFFAHQSKEVQDVMEKLALVIIDYNKAIENGFVEYKLAVEDMGEDDE